MTDPEKTPDEVAAVAPEVAPESEPFETPEPPLEVHEADEAEPELARQLANDAAVDRELRRLNRRGFVTAGAAAVAGVAGWSLAAGTAAHRRVGVALPAHAAAQ